MLYHQLNNKFKIKVNQKLEIIVIKVKPKLISKIIYANHKLKTILKKIKAKNRIMIALLNLH